MDDALKALGEEIEAIRAYLVSEDLPNTALILVEKYEAVRAALAERQEPVGTLRFEAGCLVASDLREPVPDGRYTLVPVGAETVWVPRDTEVVPGHANMDPRHWKRVRPLGYIDTEAP